jgi:hypothetical protein
VHPGRQGAKFIVRHKPALRCRFQCLRQVSGLVGIARLAQRDRVGMQDITAAIHYVNQSLGHDVFLMLSVGAARSLLKASTGRTICV